MYSASSSKNPNWTNQTCALVSNILSQYLLWEAKKTHLAQQIKKKKKKFFQSVKFINPLQASLKSVQNLLFQTSIMLNWELLKHALSEQRLEDVQECRRFKTEGTVLWSSIPKSKQRSSCHVWWECIGMLYVASQIPLSLSLTVLWRK